MTDIVNDAFNTLLSASPELITAIICIIIGYVLRAQGWFPNKLIPLTCFLVGAIAYSLIKSTSDLSPKIHNPVVVRAIFGMIIGFAAWIFHKAALKPAEDRFPWLKNFLDTCADPSAPPQPQARPVPTEPQNK